MLNRTGTIRQNMLYLDESYDRLKLLRGAYEDETAYVIATGPSLGNHDIDKLKEFLSDKFVIGMKQTYDLIDDVIDIHLLNFTNCKLYDYGTNDKTIAVWIVSMPDQIQYLMQNDLRCDVMIPLCRHYSGRENSIAAMGDFENLLIKNSFERPWGPGIMYELGFPIPFYCGSKRIVTIGWDIGDLNTEDDGKSLVKYDHIYADGVDMKKTEYDGENVQKLSVGGSGGMMYEELKMVVDSTEDLHYFLESIGVELNIVSDRNPAYNKIKRMELNEL